MDSPVVLQVTDLHKRFGEVHALRGVSLQVHEREVKVVIGASGCGKSTLLRCINRLEEPTGGQIIFRGEPLVGPGVDLDGLRRRVGMVFQRFNLFPHLTAAENVALAPRVVQGLSRAQARERALALLAQVGLADKADVHPDALSGGQQQRVAIARALAMEPELMLFDEPTSALDPELVGEVLDAMRALAAQGMTMLVATHEMSFAREAASQVVFLDEGRVVEEGPPDEILVNPQQARTRTFLHRILRPAAGWPVGEGN